MTPWQKIIQSLKAAHDRTVAGQLYLARYDTKANWEIVSYNQIVQWCVEGYNVQIAHGVYD